MSRPATYINNKKKCGDYAILLLLQKPCTTTKVSHCWLDNTFNNILNVDSNATWLLEGKERGYRNTVVILCNISFTVNITQAHIYLMGVNCHYLTCGSKVMLMAYDF